MTREAAPAGAGRTRPAWILSWVAVSLALLTLTAILFRQAPARIGGDNPHDFVQFYLVGWNVRHGEPVYGPLRTSPELEREIGWSLESDHVFANPPGVIPLLSTLSFLPYPVAWWALLLVSGSALALAVSLAAREVGAPPRVSLLAGALALCTLPALMHLVLNRFEALVVLIAVLGWIALRRGRTVIGGGLWGLCAAFKLFPALWVLGLFHRRYRRAGFSALFVATTVTLLGVVLVGLEDAAKFLTVVLPQSAIWRESEANFALVTVASRLGAAALGWVMAATLALATTLFLLRGPGSVDRILVVGVATSLLIAPLSWSYGFLFAAPCLVVLSGHLALSSWRDRLLVVGLTVTLFAWPSLLGSWGPGWLTADRAPSLALRFVPTGALLALAVVGAVRIDPSNGRRSSDSRASSRGAPRSTPV